MTDDNRGKFGPLIYTNNRQNIIFENCSFGGMLDGPGYHVCFQSDENGMSLEVEIEKGCTVDDVAKIVADLIRQHGSPR